MHQRQSSISDPGYRDDNGTPDDATDDAWVGGDFRLSAQSPCINAGDPDTVATPGDTDLAGHARVLCGRVDMGAYEFGMGDGDCDRDVDMADVAAFQCCYTGSDGPVYDQTCEGLDFDYDGDVDLEDLALFELTMFE